MTEEQKRIIVDNIKKFLKEHEMTQGQLAEKIGVAKSTMSDYMNYRSKPGAGALEKMSAVFGVTKSDIDTTYKSVVPEIIDGEIGLIRQESEECNFKGKKIPILGKIAAGVPLEAIEDIVDCVLPPYPRKENDELFGLVVNGESMNKVVPNGHYAVIRKQPDVENGEIAAVFINDSNATLKRVYKFTNLIVLEPLSHNSTFTDQHYTQDNCEDIKILGKFLYGISPQY
ncbi:LexA family protein [Bacillus sp. JJ722]|uniref:LexA family protein n=1 Tax=Bacillus sp. JJ722 TaxID=3122973 RepID=UPI002FFF1DB0